MAKKVSLIFFNIDRSVPMIKNLKVKYQGGDEYDIIHLNDSIELNQHLMTSNNGIMFFPVVNKEDLKFGVTILREHRKLIKKGLVKPVCLMGINNKKVEQVLAKNGCVDLLDPGLKVATVSYKIDMWTTSILNHLSDTERQDELKRKHKQAIMAKKTERSLKKDFLFVKAIELKSDFWLIKKRTDCKKILKNFLVKSLGPSPAVGRWVELTKQPGDRHINWKWVENENFPISFLHDEGNWFFQGSKPEFDWKTNRWFFTSEQPHLCFHFLDGRVFSRFKFQDQQVLVSENSRYALNREEKILESCDPKYNIEASEKEENKNSNIEDENIYLEKLDGKSKTDHLKQEPLSGKGQTDHLEQAPLSGKVQTDHPEQEPLSGKGQTDHLEQEPLSGKGQTEHLEQDPLAGKGETDNLEQDPLSGKGQTDHLEQNPLNGRVNLNDLETKEEEHQDKGLSAQEEEQNSQLEEALDFENSGLVSDDVVGFPDFTLDPTLFQTEEQKRPKKYMDLAKYMSEEDLDALKKDFEEEDRKEKEKMQADFVLEESKKEKKYHEDEIGYANNWKDSKKTKETSAIKKDDFGQSGKVSKEEHENAMLEALGGSLTDKEKKRDPYHNSVVNTLNGKEEQIGRELEQESKEVDLNAIIGGDAPGPDVSLESGDLKAVLKQRTSGGNDITFICGFEDFYEDELILKAPINSLSVKSEVFASITLIYNGIKVRVVSMGVIEEVEEYSESEETLIISIKKIDKTKYERFMQLYQERQGSINDFMDLAKGY